MTYTVTLPDALIVVLTFDEPDRLAEVVGGFANEEAREAWVSEVQPSLPGVTFLLSTITEPFHPAGLLSKDEVPS